MRSRVVLTATRGTAAISLTLSLFFSGTSLLLPRPVRSFTGVTIRTTTPRFLIEQQRLSHPGGGLCQKRPTWFLASTLIFPSARCCRMTSTSAATDTATSTEANTAVSDASISSEQGDNTGGILIGGDYAGLSATYKLDGSLIPIPDYLIPKSLLEWGQEPSCLEVLVSEEMFHDALEDGDTVASNGNNNKEMKGQRQTVTVLPAVGCAVDNMETTKTAHDFYHHILPIDLNLDESTSLLPPSYAMTFQDANLKKRNCIMLEAAFGLVAATDHRVRASVTLNTQTLQLVPPVTITYERQVSTTSSQGTIADGGGLDGRRVAHMMGERLRRSYNLFEKNNNKLQKDNSDDGSTDDNNDDALLVRFPCDVTIQTWRNNNKISTPEKDSDGNEQAEETIFVVEFGHTTKQEQSGDEVRQILQASLLRTTTTLEDNDAVIQFTSRVNRL